MPTEMFLHFFKSLSDAAKMNLNIKAEGTNEHHKIEGIFKAFARALKMAKKRDIFNYELPSTKGGNLIIGMLYTINKALPCFIETLTTHILIFV